MSQLGRELSFSALYCRRTHGLRPLLSKSLDFQRGGSAVIGHHDKFFQVKNKSFR
jgi:hypothetical protein